MFPDGSFLSFPFFRDILTRFHHSAVKHGVIDEFLEKGRSDAAGADFASEDDFVLLFAE